MLGPCTRWDLTSYFFVFRAIMYAILVPCTRLNLLYVCWRWYKKVYSAGSVHSLELNVNLFFALGVVTFYSRACG